MSTMDMWKANAVTLILLIVVNLALFGLGTTPWMVLGLILLAAVLIGTVPALAEEAVPEPGPTLEEQIAALGKNCVIKVFGIFAVNRN